MNYLQNAKVSVIVPVYKVEPYLRKCLDSITGQTYRNLEIILVDDGSPDNCGAICDEFAKKDERIKVIHKENGGVSSARNAGLSIATGEWVGWVDGDDWIELDMYEYLLEKTEKYGADIAVCSRKEVYPDRKVLRGWTEDLVLNRQEGLALLLKDDLLQNYLCDKLWCRELFQGVAFPEDRSYEDMAVTYRLFERAKRTVCLPQAKYNYLQRPGSIVHDSSLVNRLNYYAAAEKRYRELRENWPEMEELLLTQCVVAAIEVWCGYSREMRQTRREALPRLKEVSALCAPHVKRAGELLEVGMAGRIVMKLIPYPTWWSFALSGLVSRLYKLRRGIDL